MWHGKIASTFSFWRGHTELPSRTVSTISCGVYVHRQYIRASSDPNDGLTRVGEGVFFPHVLVCPGAMVSGIFCDGFVISVRFDVETSDSHVRILSRGQMAK
jgi:hypothetical protein